MGFFMPITIQATQGVFTEKQEQQVFSVVNDLFLKLHNLSDNPFIKPNVIGEIHTIPKGKSFSAGKPDNIVIIELKVPSFVLASAEQKQAFIGGATDIVFEATNGKHPKNRTYVNMVYAVDGLWGIAGKAYTNQELGEAVSRAAS
jgi:phenylpyruvate tautomerase PptA (4-oxalocrotonate tautomerase family)